MSFSYAELPAYLKRDLRRTFGKYREIFPMHDINGMRLAIEQALDLGGAAMVDGWGVRRSAGDTSIRRAAAAICHGKPWSFHYQRRGDLVFFTRKAN